MTGLRPSKKCFPGRQVERNNILCNGAVGSHLGLLNHNLDVGAIVRNN